MPLAESFRLDDGRLVRAGVRPRDEPVLPPGRGRRRRPRPGQRRHLHRRDARAPSPPRTSCARRWPGAPTEGLHACDPAFAGSDTLATARTLAAVLRGAGPFDLVLLGRNSVDGETGQVGPELAELLDLPFAGGVRRLQDLGAVWRLELEHDDGTQEVELTLPAVLSVAERLCDPCKVDPEGRAAVSPARADPAGLGPPRAGTVGGGGQPDGGRGDAGHGARARHAHPRRPPGGPGGGGGARADPTWRLDGAPRPGGARRRVTAGPGTGVGPASSPCSPSPAGRRCPRSCSAPRRASADEAGARVHALCADPADVASLGAAGADVVVVLQGSAVAEDVADALAAYVRETAPWAVLAPSTAFGREVAGRAAASTGSGLVGDAVALSVRDGLLVAAKPAFAGALVADITCRSATQMVTVRPGVLPAPALHGRGTTCPC